MGISMERGNPPRALFRHDSFFRPIPPEAFTSPASKLSTEYPLQSPPQDSNFKEILSFDPDCSVALAQHERSMALASGYSTDPALDERSMALASDCSADPARRRLETLRNRIARNRRRLGIPSQAECKSLRKEVEACRPPILLDDLKAESQMSFLCEVKPQRVYAILWKNENWQTKTWSLDELFAFLAEEGDGWQSHDSGRWHGPSSKYPNGHFHYTFDKELFEGGRLLARALEIDIPAKLTHCRVRVSRAWVQYQTSWNRVSLQITSRSNAASEGPTCGIYCFQREVCSAVAKSFMRGDPILSIEDRRFPSALHYVIQFLTYDAHFSKICADGYKKAYLQFLFQSVSIPREPIVSDTFETFQSELGGLLKMWVKPRWDSDQLEEFTSDDVSYSIISGCWVHPLAASILQNREQNHICCLMMDTTWSIMRQYVTAFCIAVAYNTAIPLAFAFGRVEDCELYNLFWDVFLTRYGIDLSKFRLESDQGSGLCKFAREHSITQRYCLRHLLATFKDKIFGVYLHYLIKARTLREFDALREAYRGPLHRAISVLGSHGLKRADKEFSKAGLIVKYLSGETLPLIEINDNARWEQVSSITKTLEGIPTTTNCVESINGHRNEDTPRRNTFWGSMCRTARMIERGIGSFALSVRRNFNCAARREIRFMRSIGEQEMQMQRSFYQTDGEQRTCDCGTASGLTKIYGISFPGSHLLSAGVSRPRMTVTPGLVHSLNPTSFSLILEKTARAGKEPSLERREVLVNMAAHSIKCLSRTGVRLPEIVSWVQQSFPPLDQTMMFVNNIPIPVLLLVSTGVLHYANVPQIKDSDD
jgi:hypothetical protein